MAFVIALGLAIFVLPAPWGFVAVLVGAIVEVAEAVLWIRLSRRRRVQVGPEALIGADARVVAACRPEGKVRIEGELWQARCDAGASLGETVRVQALDGLTLVVERKGRGREHVLALDRSVPTDRRGEPARPDVGAASGA